MQRPFRLLATFALLASTFVTSGSAQFNTNATTGNAQSNPFSFRKKGIVFDINYSTLQGDLNYWVAKKASAVRYQVMLKQPPDTTLNGAPFDKATTEQHVQWINSLMATIVANNMVLIVDFHVPDRKVFQFPVLKWDDFTDDWGRIVAGVGHHRSANIAFELANEQVSDDWPNRALTAAQRIRRVESARGFDKHPILYSPRGTTTSPATTFTKLPIDGPQVVVFHFWNWLTRGPNVQNTPPSAILEYPNPNQSLPTIKARLNEVQQCGISNGCPVLISEVSIDYRHPDAAAFTKDFLQAATDRNISVTWHANDGSYWVGSKRNPESAGFKELVAWMNAQ